MLIKSLLYSIGLENLCLVILIPTVYVIYLSDFSFFAEIRFIPNLLLLNPVTAGSRGRLTLVLWQGQVSIVHGY